MIGFPQGRRTVLNAGTGNLISGPWIVEDVDGGTHAEIPPTDALEAALELGVGAFGE